jgi:4-hydroxy-tetrahydrodipicolinate synthase
MKDGIWTALITPMKSPDGAIDWDAFGRILEKQAQAQVSGLVLGGTTGEAPTLSVGEKISLIRKAKAQVGSRLSIMAGTGLSSTEQSVELSRLAQDAGADGLLVVTPPYNKPSLAGLVGHFEAISQASSLPICLYHVPGRTAQFLKAEALGRLTQIPRVTMVKEASGDMAFLSRAMEAARPGTQFFSGDDPTFLPSLSLGARGIISVLSNLLPGPMVDLWEAYREGNREKALGLHRLLFPLSEGIFLETNPGPIKALMARAGLCQNVLRLPLAPTEEIVQFDRIISELSQG